MSYIVCRIHKARSSAGIRTSMISDGMNKKDCSAIPAICRPRCLGILTGDSPFYYSIGQSGIEAFLPI